MTVVPGWPAVSGAATFQDIRRDMAGLIARDATGAIRRGIFRTSDTPLFATKSTMAIDVADFVAALDRNGLVLVANNGVTTVTISGAPTSGTRWSVIYVKQRETEAPFSDGVAGPIIDKVESTTSLVQARSLLPPGALELGYVQVPAGATGTNSSGVVASVTVPYTATAGGVVPLRNQAEQDAWAPADGAVAWRVDTSALMRRADSGWRRVSGTTELASAVQTAGATTVGTSYGDMPQMAVTVPCTGAKVRITASVLWINPTSGADRVVAIRLLNDGAAVAVNPTQTVLPFFPSASVSTPATYVWEVTPTPGEHTFKLQATSSVASSVSVGPNTHMKVEEL